MIIDHDRLVPLRQRLTSFIGREALLEECQEVLRDDTIRLLTLWGPGGVGKTRLMQELVKLVNQDREDVRVVYLDEVAAADDERQLAATIAVSVGLRDNNARTPIVARLVEHLRDRRLLLVLDNCEHLVGDDLDGPLPRVVRNLLGGTNSLRVLATSRDHKIGVEGGVRIAVRPMSVAGGEHSEAMALLINRAKLVGRDITKNPRDLERAQRLCVLLEGLPLAYELIATRLSSFSLARILDDVEKAGTLGVLVGGESDRAQHRTMLSTIEWSYRLLSPSARRMWALLSLFEDGMNIDDATAVCTRMGIGAGKVSGLITELIDSSIVRMEVNDHDDPRYRLLKVLRDYGLAVLKESGEMAAARMAHADHFRDLVHTGARAWFGANEIYWMKRLDRETANIRAAHRVLASSGRIEDAADLVADAAESRFHFYGCKLGQIRSMLTLSIEVLPNDSERLVTMLSIFAHLAEIQGDPATARPLLARAEDVARALGCSESHPVLQQARVGFAWMSDFDTPDLSWETLIPQMHAVEDGFPTEGLKSMAILFTGAVGALYGDRATAMTEAPRVLANAERVGAVWAISWGYWVYAVAETLHGDLAEAMRLLRRALDIQVRISDMWGVAWTVFWLFVLLSKLGEYSSAAQVFGAAKQLLREGSADISGLKPYRRCERAAEERAKQNLRPGEWDRLVAIGAAKTDQEAIQLAKQAMTLPVKERNVGGLSNREREIIGLLTDGLSNKDIAQALHISPRTVETHVSNIIQKVNNTGEAWVSNRATLARWWQHNGISH
ncbi:LuxR C-terminal-related transcriptional regulator [Kibdelosporangium philippinense]|uniref:LuxR C-terminal-related transcriptional regulator n=1 Tax=Kibdelosporangium philippinense TaxID=211113 RepID=A0ABS8ZQ49_9PSEU|nr:LuxR C-terminal-related transcriptional regulator [Kibdelosporangium philippinense]MCE7009878.1 LuxR C-terminal-related transcriptional regulator [Kibdelosporangium philippinense]